MKCKICKDTGIYSADEGTSSYCTCVAGWKIQYPDAVVEKVDSGTTVLFTDGTSTTATYYSNGTLIFIPDKEEE